VLRSAPAFCFARPWPIVSVAIAIAASCASTTCAVGYLHYKQIAVDEALAAQRAERANIDLQDALDRLRDELVASRARIDTLENEPTGRIAAAEQYKVDRIAQMTLMLEQVPLDLQLTDPRPATFGARLNRGPTDLASGHVQQSNAPSSIDQSQKKLQRLSAEREEAIVERDHLRTRVSELEQKLSLSQFRQAPGQPALDNSSSANSTHSAASAPSAPGTAGVPPAAEQPRQVLKNFATPAWVPDQFSNESGPILGSPVPHPPRRASARKNQPS
jgi:cell division protein FtsB